jgi:hypothetical protein
MSKKRAKHSVLPRPSATTRRAPGPSSGFGPGISLVTPEGDPIAFVKARYQHAAFEEIRQILGQTDDFDFHDDEEPGGKSKIPDRGLTGVWLEVSTGVKSLFAPVAGKRILANLTLTPTFLEVDAMSQKRLDNSRKRLEQLLGERIRLAGTRRESVAQALSRPAPRTEPEPPATPPPEVIAQIEEQMLRQWIDDSIPALGGLTPRQAVKTPEGRKAVLQLIDEAGRMQRAMKKAPGTFAPDYRKVKKMLGLE